MELFGTKDVARALGLNPSRLAKAVWEDRVSAPTRGPGGCFLWSVKDADGACWYFHRRPLSERERAALAGERGGG